MKNQSKYNHENHRYANLEKFRSIDVAGDWNAVKDRIGFRKSRRISPLWRVAAIAILVLSVGFLVQQYILNPPGTIIAMSGEEQKSVLLPDGSQVFLNKYTELTYPAKFKRNSRELSIKGEGFFEVTRDPEKPFLINVADRAFVEVLGTSFNIKATEENESVSVQVVEGKVAFYTAGNENTQKILEKNDQAVMHRGTIAMNDRKDLNFLSWKTGKLYFDQSDIETVIEILSHHYDREFIIDSTVDRSLTFTSIIDNQELESVLEELSIVLGISYSMDDRRILIFNHD